MLVVLTHLYPFSATSICGSGCYSCMTLLTLPSLCSTPLSGNMAIQTGVLTGRSETSTNESISPRLSGAILISLNVMLGFGGTLGLCCLSPGSCSLLGPYVTASSSFCVKPLPSCAHIHSLWMREQFPPSITVHTNYPYCFNGSSDQGTGCSMLAQTSAIRR